MTDHNHRIEATPYTLRISYFDFAKAFDTVAFETGHLLDQEANTFLLKIVKSFRPKGSSLESEHLQGYYLRVQFNMLQYWTLLFLLLNFAYGLP